MITRVESDRDKRLCSVCKNSAVGCKILSQYFAYGTGVNFCDFWIIESENEICGAISRIDGAFFVLARTDNARALARDFLTMLAPSEVLMNGGESGKIMQLNRDKFTRTQSINITPASARDICEVMYGGLNSECAEKFYVDCSHRIRHNVLYAVCAKAEGHPVCCACAHIANGDALITTVYTNGKYRGKGLASSAVEFICELLADKNIYLMCKDELCGFYGKTGFENIGGYTIESTIF